MTALNVVNDCAREPGKTARKKTGSVLATKRVVNLIRMIKMVSQYLSKCFNFKGNKMLKNKPGRLVLTRRINESFILKLDENIDPQTPIGDVFDEVVITLNEINHSQAKFMISANQSISILRSELIRGDK